jgi:RNA-binding protein
MEITSARMRELKAQSQRLNPSVRVGKSGVNAAFYRTLDSALSRQQLVKLKFESLKEQKKELVPEIARLTFSRVILFVGNTVTLYREKAETAPGITPESNTY